MGEVQKIDDPMVKVMELFLELKDTSELMVDLAYTSLLYNDRELAAEVMSLGEGIDDMSSQLRRSAVEQLSSKSSDATLMVLRMCSYANSIADAALSIVDVVLRDIEPHPILKQSIKESDASIFKVEISGKSVLREKRIMDIRLATETGMWIIAIKRRSGWIIGPGRDEKLVKGDILFTRGPDEGMRKLRGLASGKLKKIE